MLRVRDFSGFISTTKVDKQYLLNTESFSVYYKDIQVCRMSYTTHIVVEIFDTKLYGAVAEYVSLIVGMY